MPSHLIIIVVNISSSIIITRPISQTSCKTTVSFGRNIIFKPLTWLRCLMDTVGSVWKGKAIWWLTSLLLWQKDGVAWFAALVEGFYKTLRFSVLVKGVFKCVKGGKCQLVPLCGKPDRFSKQQILLGSQTFLNQPTRKHTIYRTIYIGTV